MKVIFAFAALVAVALAAPPSGPDGDATVLRSDFENIGVDGYQYAYETSNGINAQEQGELTNQGTDNEAISVRGSYSYVGPDGVTYTVTYIANDQEGFKPTGEHIPRINN